MAHSFLCLLRSMGFGPPESFAAPGAPLEHQTQRMSSIFMALMSRDGWVLGRVKDADPTLLNLNSRSFRQRRQKSLLRLR